MAKDYTGNINSIYDESLKAQKAKLRGTYDQNAATYDKQLSEAPEKYQTLKNEAYVNNAQTERARQESMANMGLSGAGGTSQTLQQRNTNTLLNTLGDASRHQQSYIDDINLNKANMKTQYDADTQSLVSQSESDKNAALLSASQWGDNYDLQEKQYALSEQESAFNRDLQNRQFTQGESENVFNQAYSLYAKKYITKAQFEAMTGIDIR